MKSHGDVPAGRRAGSASAARLVAPPAHRARVRLLESTLVDVPTVIGWIKPVVLLPASALAGSRAAAARGDPRARARAHPPSRLPRQPAADARRDAALLSPGRLVAVAPDSRRARELLRRSGRQPVRRSATPTRARSPISRSCARHRGQLVLAATGGSLLQRVRRLLGAPSHAGARPAGSPAARPSSVDGSAIAAERRAGLTRSQCSRRCHCAVARVVARRRCPRSGTVRREATARRRRPARAAAPGLAHAQVRRRLRGCLNCRARRARPADAAAAADPACAARAVIAQGTPARRSGALREPAQRAGRRRRRSTRRDRRPRSPTAASLAAAADARRRPRGAALEPVPRRCQRTPRSPPSAALRHRRQRLAGAEPRHLPWSNNGDKLEVKYDGEIEFTDDDTDVKRLSPGGLLRIRDGGWLGGHTVEFTADASGNVTRRFWVGSAGAAVRAGRPAVAGADAAAVHPPDRASARPRASRGSSKRAADRRAGRDLADRRQLGEARSTSASCCDRARSTPPPLAAGARAGGPRDRLGLRARLAPDRQRRQAALATPPVRQAYFDAARTHRVRLRDAPRVLVGAQARPRDSRGAGRHPRGEPQHRLRLRGGVAARSDREAAAARRDDARAVLRGARHGRERLRAPPRAERRSPSGTRSADRRRASMLESAIDDRSDFEARRCSCRSRGSSRSKGPLRAPFFRAVDSIQSAFERGRVLQAVVSRADASTETMLAVLRAAEAMSSSFETSQVLLRVAAGARAHRRVARRLHRRRREARRLRTGQGAVGAREKRAPQVGPTFRSGVPRTVPLFGGRR